MGKPTAQQIADRVRQNAPAPQPEEIMIPDFVVRQVGALQLQLANANETIAQLQQQLAAAQALDGAG